MGKDNKQKQAPEAKNPSPAHPTRGFGVPLTVAPHHFVVTIPRKSKDPVLITEDLGMHAEGGSHEILDRISLPREAWVEIADPVKRMFNQRLKEHDLAISRWKTGDNPVDRLLGKELCVLAWAIEKLEADRRGTALRNWLSLRPEERWWLFQMTASTAGTPGDYDRGWRLALRYALGDTFDGQPLKTRKKYQTPNPAKQLLLPFGEE